jgi:DNA-binding HxlR family transcriptional regulator
MSKGRYLKRASRSAPKGNVCSGDCPSRSVLDHVTSRWSTLILVLLLEKTHRFSELARRIGGVSERMLAHSLRALEADGLVLRVVHPTKPPRVEYSLTELGRELAVHVRSLTNWVEDNVSRVLKFRQSHSSTQELRNG